MPALTTKDKLVKRVQTPTRIHPKSLTNNDVKRLGSTRRISSKRTQTQSIQTQTILACAVLHAKYNKIDEGTQTNDDLENLNPRPANGFASRLVRFMGGTLVSFMKLFKNFE